MRGRLGSKTSDSMIRKAVIRITPKRDNVPVFHGLGPFSGDQSEKTIYARISGSISEHWLWQSLRMLPSFIVVRVKGSFLIFVGKLKNNWNDGIF